jgi:hypothetical protein
MKAEIKFAPIIDDSIKVDSFALSDNFFEKTETSVTVGQSYILSAYINNNITAESSKVINSADEKLMKYPQTANINTIIANQNPKNVLPLAS